MSGFFIHKEPEGADRKWAPLGDSETFEAGDPVQLVSQQLSDCPDDASPLEDGELIGFAVQPATGIHSSTRTGAANGFGAAENDRVPYIPAKAPGLQIRTRNYWTTPGTQIAKAGSIIGTLKQISSPNGTNNWGVESTAGTPGTDATFHVDEVLDDDMVSIDADASLAAGVGWVVGHIVGDTQNETGGA